MNNIFSKINEKIWSKPLTKTGQITSYISEDDGDLEKGWAEGTRFITETIGGDYIVHDRATGLTWAGDVNEAGGGNGSTIDWDDAIIWASGLSFAGQSDWRIPNVKELASLVIYDAALAVALDPLIDETFFLNFPRVKFWTSTTYTEDTSLAFYVSFEGGYARGISKTAQTFNLLCVRGGV